MESDTNKFSKAFSQLSKAVEDFIHEINNQKLNNMATEKWIVKDVLCHIVFWHQYYAKQYAALADGRKPFIFTSKGGSTRNQEGVNSIKQNIKEDLVKMLNRAQSSLYNSIVLRKVPEMDYTDRKHYRTEDFLDIVTRHIKRHSTQVSRAKKVPDKVH